MAGGSNGYRAALVRRQLTPALISSLPGTAGLAPFIFFSTSYPELDSAVRRVRWFVRSRNSLSSIRMPKGVIAYFKTLEFELLLQPE